MWFERRNPSRVPLLQHSSQDLLTAGELSNTQRVELIWRRLSRFIVLYAVGWGLALAYYNLLATPLHYRWPRNSFLYDPTDRYFDLITTWVQANAPHAYFDVHISPYLPLPYAVLRTMGNIAVPELLLIYLSVTFGAVLSIWVWWLRKQRTWWRGDARWTVFAVLSFSLIACNYPLLFAADRGNLDPLAMCLMYGAMELIAHDRSVTGGLVLALASASKGFPFAAILYWIKRRRFLAAVVAVLGIVACILVPALALDGDVSLTVQGLRRNWAHFQLHYVVGPMSSHYSTDWLNAIRILGRWLGANPAMTTVVPWYEGIAAIWAGVLAFLALFVVQSRWREHLTIVIIILSFPNVSNDYKLIFLMPPILEWITSTATGWRNTVFGTTAALLMLPKHFHFPLKGDEASISCIINPVLISVMSTVLWPTSAEIGRFRDSVRNGFRRVRALRLGPDAEQLPQKTS